MSTAIARPDPNPTEDPESGQIRRVYYRHGEIAVLLGLEQPDAGAPLSAKTLWNTLNAPAPPESRATLDSVTLGEIAALFFRPIRGGPPLASFGVELHPTTPTRGPWGKGTDRPALPMQQGIDPSSLPRTLPVLQVLNLASWIEDPVHENDPAVLNPTIAHVGLAVRGLNAMVRDARNAPIMVGSYKLLAVSPNWLALPFEG